MNWKKGIIILSALIIASLVISYFTVDGFKNFIDKAYTILSSGDKQRISEWVNQFGFWGPLLIVVIMIAQMFLIVIPSPLIMVVAVLAYGAWWGSVISYASVFVASTVGYWIGHAAGDSLIDNLLGKSKREKTTEYVERYGVWAVILARVSPFLSNDAISFIGGLIRMGYFKFMLATTIGIIPLIGLIAYLGEDMDKLKNSLYWISGIGIVVFALYLLYQKNSKVREKVKRKSKPLKKVKDKISKH
jgi:uncharacterized membrane protein YdjX (TVP38/TMEM64 family)